MDLTDLILLILGCVGLTLITSMGHVFKPLKARIKTEPWITFSMCPQCQGFWIGFIGHIVFFWSPFDVWFWLWSVLFGGMVSMVSMIVQSLITPRFPSS